MCDINTCGIVLMVVVMFSYQRHVCCRQVFVDVIAVRHFVLVASPLVREYFGREMGGGQRDGDGAADDGSQFLGQSTIGEVWIQV